MQEPNHWGNQVNVLELWLKVKQVHAHWEEGGEGGGGEEEGGGREEEEGGEEEGGREEEMSPY